MRLTYVSLQASREGQASHAHVHEIVRGLEALGWAVRLVEPHSPPASRLGFLERLTRIAETELKALRKASMDSDAIYIRSHPLTLPITLSARARRLPIVHELNGPFSDATTAWPVLRPLAPAITRTMAYELTQANAIVANTPQLKSWLLSRLPLRRVEIIPNGANTLAFRPDATTTLQLPERFVVFFGAFAPWQGIPTILSAINHPAWPEDVHLVFAGDGVERSSVLKAAARNPRILYLGTLQYSQVPGLIAKSLAGLSPKNNVGGHLTTGLSPLKVYETLACGVPAIVTDIPGQTEVIQQEQCGIIIPIDDAPALARAVATLSRDDTLRRTMGARGRAAIVSRHSWAARAKQTHDLLIDLLSSDHRQGRDPYSTAA